MEGSATAAVNRWQIMSSILPSFLFPLDTDVSLELAWILVQLILKLE